MIWLYYDVWKTRYLNGNVISFSVDDEIDLRFEAPSPERWGAARVSVYRRPKGVCRGGPVVRDFPTEIMTPPPARLLRRRRVT